MWVSSTKWSMSHVWVTCLRSSHKLADRTSPTIASWSRPPRAAGQASVLARRLTGQTVEVGRALGMLTRSIATSAPDDSARELRASGLDEWAADNLIRVKEQQELRATCPGQDVGDRGDFVTNSVTGVSSCIHPSVRVCTPMGVGDRQPDSRTDWARRADHACRRRHCAAHSGYR